MINTDEIIRQLTANAEAIRALVQTLPNEEAQWKPTPADWSIKDVMEHVYNEERIDFRMHLKEMLNDPPQAWGSFNQEGYVTRAGCRQALEGFLSEREASITWLKTLESPDWDRTVEAPFGPFEEKMTLSAGDVLVSWVEHDFLHIRQLNELLYAWIEKQAPPYSVQYAGGW